MSGRGGPPPGGGLVVGAWRSRVGRHPLGQRPGERRRPGPPGVEGGIPQRHRHVGDGDAGQLGGGEQAGQPVGVVEREGAGDAGWWHGRAQLGADRVEHHAQPGVARPGTPHRDRDPAAGSQDPADLGHRPGRVEGEHEALAAEDDVVGLIGLVEVVKVEGQGADVVQPERGGTGRGDRCHLGGDIGQDHLAARADQLGRGDPDAARAAGQFEYALAGPGCRQLEQLGGDGRAAGVGIDGVLGPCRSYGRPHPVKPGAEGVASRGVVVLPVGSLDRGAGFHGGLLDRYGTLDARSE